MRTQKLEGLLCGSENRLVKVSAWKDLFYNAFLAFINQNASEILFKAAESKIDENFIAFDSNKIEQANRSRLIFVKQKAIYYRENLTDVSKIIDAIRKLISFDNVSDKIEDFKIIYDN